MLLTTIKNNVMTKYNMKTIFKILEQNLHQGIKDQKLRQP